MQQQCSPYAWEPSSEKPSQQKHGSGEVQMPIGSQLTLLLYLHLGSQSLHLVFPWVSDTPPGPECLPGFALVPPGPVIAMQPTLYSC